MPVSEPGDPAAPAGPPDFYLGERSEYVVPDFDGQVRACWVLGRVKARRSKPGDDRRYLWVQVDPPLQPGPPMPPMAGLGTELVLGERHEGTDLDNLGDGWISVHLFEIRRPAGLREGVVEPGAVELYAWADVARLPSLLPPTPEEMFARALRLLERFAAREGHAEVPDGHQEDGVQLAIWISNMRFLHADGDLAADWAARLEAVPGWRWKRRD